MRSAAQAHFHDPRGFAFLGALCRRWREILAEYLAVRDRAVEWVERDLHGGGWKVFGLYDFPSGAPLPDNVARCPFTAALIASHVPRHGAAGFSVLRPGTRIQAHTGYRGEFLRCHLGLRVPRGDCGLRVGGELRRWRAGEALVLDDRFEHEAWNLAPRERVVLLVDFVPGR